MIEPNIFGAGLDDSLDLNTAEALGFSTKECTTSYENPFIIPDEDEFSALIKKLRPIPLA